MAHPAMLQDISLVCRDVALGHLDAQAAAARLGDVLSGDADCPSNTRLFVDALYPWTIEGKHGGDGVIDLTRRLLVSTSYFRATPC